MHTRNRPVVKLCKVMQVEFVYTKYKFKEKGNTLLNIGCDFPSKVENSKSEVYHALSKHTGSC